MQWRENLEKIIFITAMLLILVSTGVHANLIQNGSFETRYANWSYSNVDWWSGWTPKDGSISIDVSAGSAGWIQQSFATVQGSKYTVTFWLAGNPQGNPIVKHLDVSAGNVLNSYTFNKTGKTTSNMGWTEESFIFTAVGSTTTLKFQSQDNTAYGPAIDLVSVEKAAVPIPSAILLFIPGLAGVLASKRRFVR
jgi:choice-of-anchor C domain-containing protein